MTWLAAILALAAALVAIPILGKQSWQKLSDRLTAPLKTPTIPTDLPHIRHQDFETLPAPVARYLRTVLPENTKPIVQTLITHQGTFNSNPEKPDWKPFRSTQIANPFTQDFDWNGHIQMGAGLTVNVHDAHINGQGILIAKIMGLIPVASLRDTPVLNQGELVRFLAEATWYPTVLAPGQGITWEPIDAASARAHINTGKTQTSLVYHFNDEGLVESVFAESRARTVGKSFALTPWQGKFWDYQSVNGILVPHQAEVAWIIDNQDSPYWRGTIQTITHQLTP